ncbi:MAG: M20/M25/M40 family metallo-hydrolase [Chloroflexi bacterium]|nr:M20/M25/M40 family metallo-hydrolase [Chloroflexota bacterium]
MTDWRIRAAGHAGLVLSSLLVALALVLTPAPGRPVAADERGNVPTAFSAEAAYQHVVYLAASIGSRPAGSAAEAAAAAYLAEQLAGYGYQVALQPFTIQVYEERGAYVAPLDGGDPIEATALLRSAAGVVRGELVDAGRGQPDEWPAGALAGRVALIERGEIPFGEKVANAAAAGAVAVIIYNNEPGTFAGSLGQQSAIPAVALDRAQGLALRTRSAAEPLSVEVAVDASVGQRQSQNVVGTRVGSDPCTIVVGAHYDSVSAGPGANDNGSGTATMLEVARVMAERSHPCTLQFVAFGAEEIGLRGSQRFVETLPPEGHPLRAMLNLDMVGVGQEWWLAGAPELIDAAQAVAESLGFEASIGSPAGASSDHESFARAGVPVLFVHRRPDPNYHSPRDRAEYVEPELLATAGALTLGVLEHLAVAEE